MDDPDQDLAPGAAIKIIEGKLLDMSKNILADAMDDALAGPGGQPRLKIASGFGAAGRKEIEHRHQDNCLNILLRDQGVDDYLGEDGA